MVTFDYALSIGPTCAAAHHLRRAFKRHALHGIFDWQITPIDAFEAYLNRDFQGCLEYEDLLFERGKVSNRSTGTVHVHEFDDHDINRSMTFAKAKARHIYLCSQTRDALQGKYGKLLLQLSETRPSAELDRMNSMVRHYNPTLRFTINNGPPLPLPHEDWRGDLDLWNRAFLGVGISAASRIHSRLRRLLSSPPRVNPA